jgi:hypothetical protein
MSLTIRGDNRLLYTNSISLTFLRELKIRCPDLTCLNLYHQIFDSERVSNFLDLFWLYKFKILALHI